MNSTTAGSMNDNINMKSTIAGSMNENICMVNTIIESTTPATQKWRVQ